MESNADLLDDIINNIGGLNLKGGISENNRYKVLLYLLQSDLDAEYDLLVEFVNDLIKWTDENYPDQYSCISDPIVVILNRLISSESRDEYIHHAADLLKTLRDECVRENIS